MNDQVTESAGMSEKPRLLPMAEIDTGLRESAARRELIPIECRASWLVPVRSAASAERLYLTGFLYSVTGLAGQPKQVMRPRYLWTIDASTGRVVELVDCQYRDFASSVPGGASVGTLTPDMLPAA